jgi:hypothetical protein
MLTPRDLLAGSPGCGWGCSQLGKGMQDDFVPRLLRALLSGRVEFRDVHEVARRFIPQERFDLLSAKLEHEALFLSIAAYSFHTPQRFGCGQALCSDEDYHSALSVQLSRSADTLCAVNDRQARSLHRLLLRTKNNKQKLIEKLSQHSRIYYDLKLTETDILRKHSPISAEKRMQKDELLYLPDDA